MKEVSAIAKVSFGLAAAVVVIAFTLVVDYGVNAGLVHRGVQVSGFDVGALTFQETRRTLSERRALLQNEDVCFFSAEFEACINPKEIGWFPSIESTTREAFEVGRDGSLLVSLRERAQSYASPINVRWQGGPNGKAVGRLLNQWEERLEASGLELDRARMRFKIRRGITAYPRRAQRFALEE